jgi:hypothetical protein
MSAPMSECIMIRMKDQTGEEMMFKIKNSTKMSKVFSRYAQHKRAKQASLCFLLNGEGISETDTPTRMFKLKDEDQTVYCVHWCRSATYPILHRDRVASNTMRQP